jgi:integrase
MHTTGRYAKCRTPQRYWVLRERGRKGLPCDELYRQLFNPQLYLLAHGRIYSNQGAMTPGATQETADGMSMGKIGAIIEAMRCERYRFSPARRTYIPKRNGKLRPLGLPTWSDKLVGEVVRLLLEAYYEPQFSDRSHGFRPGRGCHTALRDIAIGWTGTTWFIEGAISDCFSSLDHEVMIKILAEKIRDNRFLRLIRNMLTAGYLEDWRWNATLSGVIDLRLIEPRWLREIVKDWARSARPYLQRLRETVRACQAASHALTAGGPADPAGLGAGDFTRVLDAISAQRRADGTLYSASHRNLMIYQFCQVIEYGRASGLMTTVPDPFRPAARHRVHDDPNEDELGKALPETVIRQLDARLHLLGPAGRAGAIPAGELKLMHQTIYQILRDTGRRPGETVSLHTDCVEVTSGQHNLIYDNHKAGRMRRRLPITSDTAEIILSWQQHRAQLRIPAAQDRWLFPTPLLRARQSRGHVTSACVARAFKIWVGQIGVIDSELPGPGGTPAPFSPSLITPYALRHSYAQRHADAEVPVDVLKELMDHVSVTTTMGY